MTTLKLRTIAAVWGISALISVSGSGSVLGADPAQTVIELDSTPPGASVTLDDRPVGTTPTRIENKVTPGKHLLRLELEGHQAFEKVVDVQSVTRLNIKLTPLSTATPDASANKPAEKKPLILERAAPAEKPRRTLEDQEADDTADTKPGDNRLTPVTAEPVPLERTWILGLWFGYGAKTITQAPGDSYGSIAFSVQRRVFDRMGLQARVGANLATSLDPIVDPASSNEAGTLRGFELGIGVPFFPLDLGEHEFSLTPEFGFINHGYKFTDVLPGPVVGEVAHYRIIQTRIGMYLNYYYMPYDKYAGTIGVGGRVGMSAFSDSGHFLGEMRFDFSAGMLVRF